MTDKKELDMTEHEKCIHYPICLVNNYIHKRCGYYIEEPKHGEWITKKGEMGTFCSVCDKLLPCTDEYDYETDFCPNCGADMRKEGEAK